MPAPDFRCYVQDTRSEIVRANAPVWIVARLLCLQILGSCLNYCWSLLKLSAILHLSNEIADVAFNFMITCKSVQLCNNYNIRAIITNKRKYNWKANDYRYNGIKLKIIPSLNTFGFVQSSFLGSLWRIYLIIIEYCLDSLCSQHFVPLWNPIPQIRLNVYWHNLSLYYQNTYTAIK